LYNSLLKILIMIQNLIRNGYIAGALFLALNLLRYLNNPVLIKLGVLKMNGLGLMIINLIALIPRKGVTCLGDKKCKTFKGSCITLGHIDKLNQNYLLLPSDIIKCMSGSAWY